MFKSIQRAGDLLSSPIANHLRGSTDQAGATTGRAKFKLNTEEKIVNLLWGAGIISKRHVSADIRSANVTSEMDLHSRLTQEYGEIPTKLAFLEHGRSANGFSVEGKPISERLAERLTKSAAAHRDNLPAAEQRKRDSQLTPAQEKSKANWEAFSKLAGYRSSIEYDLSMQLQRTPSPKLVDDVVASHKQSMDKAVRATGRELDAGDFAETLTETIKAHAQVSIERNTAEMKSFAPIVNFARTTFPDVTPDMNLFTVDLIKYMYVSGNPMSNDIFPRVPADGKPVNSEVSFGRGAQACLKELDSIRTEISSGKAEPEEIVGRLFKVQQACAVLEAAKPTTAAGQSLVKAMKEQSVLFFDVITAPKAPVAAQVS